MLNRDLADQVFSWTRGHPGAVADVLRITKDAVRFSEFV